MNISPRPPTELYRIQRWFAGIITRPMDANSALQPVAPNGSLMVEEAAHYIAPSSTLESFQRIEIYNQQYWWRLLKILQDYFPFLLRLFGTHAFNEQIAIPYLQRFPSTHWSLSYLGDRLPFWIRRYYHSEDKPLVYAAAAIDKAFNHSFIVAHHPCLQTSDLLEGETFLHKILYLQSHITLFSFKHHFFDFRQILLENTPEHWIEQDWPPLIQEKKPLTFMIWRDSMNVVGWVPLDPIEYLLLKKIKLGASFAELCTWIEKQRPSIYRVAVQHLQQWSHRWAINEWLTLQSPVS